MATALALPAYEVPNLAWRGEVAERAPIVWWAIYVGFAYAAALLYAAYCTSRGGNPDISLTWRGFKVACHR